LNISYLWQARDPCNDGSWYLPPSNAKQEFRREGKAVAGYKDEQKFGKAVSLEHRPITEIVLMSILFSMVTVQRTDEQMHEEF
jgi:hypothetical protein